MITPAIWRSLTIIDIYDCHVSKLQLLEIYHHTNFVFLNSLLRLQEVLTSMEKNFSVSTILFRRRGGHGSHCGSNESGQGVCGDL